MKLAILGGSFNPIHIGHLYLADTVLESFDYDRVIMIPAFKSPFKTAAEGPPAQDRLDMLAASIPGDIRLAIDDCEINREGVSYTIDTVKDIIARYGPEGKPGLILGDDLASTFHNWKDPGEIAELADIIIARRLPGGPVVADNAAGPGVDNAGPDNASGLGAVFPYPYRALDNDVLNISSRMVRERISLGEAWRYLVPPAARNIIESRRLYGFSSVPDRDVSLADKSGDSLKKLTLAIENEVRQILAPQRFVHSRNVAIMAWDLALRFGLDCQKAYLAGIAHDMCKGTNEEELQQLAKKDGAGISKLEMKKPGLLHGRAAAVLVNRKYGINDQDVLDAILYHTTGTADMDSMAKIIYVADKIEMSRTGVDPSLRRMGETADLDILFKAVLDNTVAQLRARDLDISYGTRRLLASMERRSMQ